MCTSTSSYTQGYDAATVNTHRSRSAGLQADYLLPYIQPGNRILDVGCGPASITCDFAALVGEHGKVIGVDFSNDVLESARQEAARRGLDKDAGTLEFRVASAEDLPFADGEFDIVHCHALLVHVGDAQKVMGEMRRVCKVGGWLGAREPDMETCAVWPEEEAMRRWREVQAQLKRQQGAEPNAGRRLGEWALRAGFEEEQIRLTSDALHVSGSVEVERWGKRSEERVKGEMGKRAMESGLATEDEIEETVRAFWRWSQRPMATFAMLHMRLLCRK